VSTKHDLAQRRLRDVLAQHGTQTKAAQSLKISQSYFNDLLAGRRDFSDAMLAKLGLRRAVVEARS
jgi:plasmid maintenance system antidote protein VapI